jgi:hypothetical protein
MPLAHCDLGRRYFKKKWEVRDLLRGELEVVDKLQ